MRYNKTIERRIEYLMECIYNGRKHKIFSRVKIPKGTGKRSQKGFLYFIRIGEATNRKFKIGTANDILRRMTEHAGYYKEPIYILWVSPVYSKYTTLRIEDRQKEEWIAAEPWEYLENDRFIIPLGVEEITIRVRREYAILLE